MTSVLLTGAGGNLGKVLRASLAGEFDMIRLSDVAEMDPAGPGEEVVQCDLGHRGLRYLPRLTFWPAKVKRGLTIPGA